MHRNESLNSTITRAIIHIEAFQVKYATSVPATVAERAKERTVFARADTGTVGSNPTQDMDI
jgi:hypothetical protein